MFAIQVLKNICWNRRSQPWFRMQTGISCCTSFSQSAFKKQIICFHPRAAAGCLLQSFGLLLEKRCATTSNFNVFHWDFMTVNIKVVFFFFVKKLRLDENYCYKFSVEYRFGPSNMFWWTSAKVSSFHSKFSCFWLRQLEKSIKACSYHVST